MKSAIERQPFLTLEEIDCAYESRSCKCNSLHRRLRYWIISFIAHCTILSSLALICRATGIIPRNWCKMQTPEVGNDTWIYSPIPHSALTYNINFPAFDSWDNGLYMGTPTEESDHAWNHLLGQETFRITNEETIKLNISIDNAVPLKLGGGYAGILGVTHNLHCLRRIRQWRYSEYYYPNQTLEERERDEHHLGHCLEAMRQSVMCNADLTPYPYYHSGIIDHDFSANPSVRTKCLNYELLHRWMKRERIAVQGEF